jgi:hypothetical protein
MPSLTDRLAALHARHAREVLDLLATAPAHEVADALRAARIAPRRTPAQRRPQSQPAAPSDLPDHADAATAAVVVAHLRSKGPGRAKDVRKALGLSRGEVSRALEIAVGSKAATRSGEGRLATYRATVAKSRSARRPPG